MDNLLNDNRLNSALGNWDWQPQVLKEQYGQLTIADVRFEFGKENEMLTRIGIRLDKTRQQVISILKNLRPF